MNSHLRRMSWFGTLYITSILALAAVTCLVQAALRFAA